MNGNLWSNLRVLGRELRRRVAYGWLLAARTSPGPLLTRVAVALAALIALAAAYPIPLGQPAGVVLIALAAAPAIAPRGVWPGLIVTATVLGWLFSTVVTGEPATLGRLTLVTCGLYFVHTGSALASTLPYDAVVPARILLRWWLRAAAVVAASMVLGLGGLIAAGRLASVRNLAVPLLGLAIAALLVSLLVRSRSRSPANPE